jgi:hypothetical protein
MRGIDCALKTLPKLTAPHDLKMASDSPFGLRAFDDDLIIRIIKYAYPGEYGRHVWEQMQHVNEYVCFDEDKVPWAKEREEPCVVEGSGISSVSSVVSAPPRPMSLLTEDSKVEHSASEPEYIPLPKCEPAGSCACGSCEACNPTESANWAASAEALTTTTTTTTTTTEPKTEAKLTKGQRKRLNRRKAKEELVKQNTQEPPADDTPAPEEETKETKQKAKLLKILRAGKTGGNLKTQTTAAAAAKKKTKKPETSGIDDLKFVSKHIHLSTSKFLDKMEEILEYQYDERRMRNGKQIVVLKFEFDLYFIILGSTEEDKIKVAREQVDTACHEFFKLMTQHKKPLAQFGQNLGFFIINRLPEVLDIFSEDTGFTGQDFCGDADDDDAGSGSDDGSGTGSESA